MNRNVKKRNLKEKTFVSMRLICDHIRAVDALGNGKALLCSASNARSRKYCAYLDEQKQQKRDRGATLGAPLAIRY